MKTAKFNFAKLKKLQAFTPVLVVGLLIATGAVIYEFGAHAATAGFYFNSPATAYKVGDSFDVSIYEQSNSDCANVVQADFTYPAANLHYVKFDATGSKYESPAVSPVDRGGSVSIVQFTTRKECGNGATKTSGVSGEQLIGKVTFTALKAGTAVLNFQDSSTAISASDNKTDIAPGSTARTFTITAPVVVTPPTTPPTPPTTPPTPPTTPPTPPTTPPTPPTTPPTPPTTPPTPPVVTRPAPTPVVAITPTGSDQSIPLQDNSVVELTSPVDVNPLPVQPDGVNKVEYVLNGKVVATVKTAPYTYKLDTTKLLNGTYQLVTKTYYANGQTKSVSQTVNVNNPFSLAQIRLWLAKYIWLVILIILVVAAAIAAWIIHRRGSDGGNYPNGDASYDYTVSDTQAVSSPEVPIVAPNNISAQPEPTTITPSSAASTTPAAASTQDDQSYMIRPTESRQ